MRRPRAFPNLLNLIPAGCLAPQASSQQQVQQRQQSGRGSSSFPQRIVACLRGHWPAWLVAEVPVDARGRERCFTSASDASLRRNWISSRPGMTAAAVLAATTVCCQYGSGGSPQAGRLRECLRCPRACHLVPRLLRGTEVAVLDPVSILGCSYVGTYSVGRLLHTTCRYHPDPRSGSRLRVPCYRVCAVSVITSRTLLVLGVRCESSAACHMVPRLQRRTQQFPSPGPGPYFYFSSSRIVIILP